VSDSILPSFAGPEAGTPDSGQEEAKAPKQIGPYRIDGVLGRGGMGVVYRAHHLELEQDRALKLMSRPDNPKGVARFRREATNLARVRHKNVVHIFEFGEHEGKLFFAMEFVEGTPLDKLLRERPPSFPRALRTLIGIAEGVQALHDSGVIHRDLKPGNIVVTDERPVVLDLGLAVNPELDQRLTRTGATLGTINYMAPEQFKSAKGATEKTDIYCLGLLLFELTTGKPAVDKTKAHHDVSKQILKGKWPKPSRVNPDLPLALDGICARALAQDPEARWKSAAAMADRVRQLLEHPGPTRRQERNKLIAICAAGLVGLAVGLFFAFPAATIVGGRAPGEVGNTGTTPVVSTTRAHSKRELREARAAMRPLLKAHSLPPDRRYAAARSWLAAYPRHPERDKVEAAAAEALLQVPFDSLPHRLVHRAAFVRAGEQVLSAGDTTIRLWDVASGEELRIWPVTGRVWSLATHGERFAVAGDLTTIFVGTLDTKAGLLLKRAHTKSRARALAFSTDGALLAAGSAEGVEVFDMASNTRLRTLPPPRNPVVALAFSGAGEHLAVLSGVSLNVFDKREATNQLTIWELETGAVAQTHDYIAFPQALSFAGDGQTVVVATDGRRLLTYDVASGPLGELIGAGVTADISALRAAHDGVIRGVAVARDMDRVFSVSGNTGAPRPNNQIRVWDLRSSTLVHSVEARPTRQTHVDAAPGGSRFLVCVPDAVELWDVGALDAN
jgi:WD40 repeat protein/predicted Ser/Thr protein kinase